MNRTLIKNATIINEGRTFTGSVLIEDDKIAAVYEGTIPAESGDATVIDATGKYLLPGAIDDQVHFREPGLTHKGDIASESRAAVAGGVTTFMDMPNTKPQTTTLADLEWKLQRGAEMSVANYSFFFGGTNDNMDEIRKLDRSRVPGLKLFLGSSTGNMLVDKKDSLERIFGEAGMLIAIHAEKEEVIKRNIAHYTGLHGDDLDISFHSKIRSEEACYASSSEAVELATRLGSRLHILHLSTAKELSLLSNKLPISEKKITGEVCVHHLWFYDGDYEQFGNRIKWNPSIKTLADRTALREAVNNNTIDIVATDHAPHTEEDKRGGAPGMVGLETAFSVCYTKLCREYGMPLADLSRLMSRGPAEILGLNKGLIAEGYDGDVVLVELGEPYTVRREDFAGKSKNTPYDGLSLYGRVACTVKAGRVTYGTMEAIG